MSLFTLLISLLVFPSTQEFDLTVSIDGYSEVKGEMHIGVYNKAEGFREIDQTFTNKIISVKRSTITYSFKSIPKGSYAVSVFHDVNGNGKMDKGLFGIPSEPYGFSSNPEIGFGPPSFEECKIILTANREIKIHLN